MTPPKPPRYKIGQLVRPTLLVNGAQYLPMRVIKSEWDKCHSTWVYYLGRPGPPSFGEDFLDPVYNSAGEPR